MTRADDGGGEHEQVAGAGGVEAVGGHQQSDGDHADPGREIEPRRQPATVEQRREDQREADDQSGVGGAGVRHAVRLQHQDRRLREAEDQPGLQLLPGDAANQRDKGEPGDAVAEEQHSQHRCAAGRGLGGEIARTPDDGDQQQDEIGTAGSGHGFSGEGSRR